ncbi:MAG: type III secretion T3S chaperone [Chlamydiota bacterium]
MSQALPPYPLAQILEIKMKRQEEAEKEAIQKRELRDKETKILKEAEAKRDEVRNHYQDKLRQVRMALDEAGSNTRDITQMRDYMKIVKEKLLKEEGLVIEQKKKLDAAEIALESALKIVKEKRLEVDKIKTHKDEWITQTSKELSKEEEKLLDEVGTTMFYGRKAKERKDE